MSVLRACATVVGAMIFFAVLMAGVLVTAYFVTRALVS